MKEVLLPAIGSGKKILLDNASFHKSGRLREMVREGGCELLYLPKYSPDMNKIEQQWYGIKQRVRKSEGTEESLQERVDEAIRHACQPKS